MKNTMLKQLTDIKTGWTLVLTSPLDDELDATKLQHVTLNHAIMSGKEVSIMYWITGILGLTLAVSPWLFSYATNPTALWTSVVVGLATAFFSWVEGAQNDKGRWEYWTVALLGAFAIIAPFVLGFGNYASAMWTSVTVGFLLAVFAGGKLSAGDFKNA